MFNKKILATAIILAFASSAEAQIQVGEDYTAISDNLNNKDNVTYTGKVKYDKQINNENLTVTVNGKESTGLGDFKIVGVKDPFSWEQQYPHDITFNSNLIFEGCSGYIINPNEGTGNALTTFNVAGNLTIQNASAFLFGAYSSIYGGGNPRLILNVGGALTFRDIEVPGLPNDHHYRSLIVLNNGSEMTTNGGLIIEDVRVLNDRFDPSLIEVANNSKLVAKDSSIIVNNVAFKSDEFSVIHMQSGAKVEADSINISDIYSDLQFDEQYSGDLIGIQGSRLYDQQLSEIKANRVSISNLKHTDRVIGLDFNNGRLDVSQLRITGLTSGRHAAGLKLMFGPDDSNVHANIHEVHIGDINGQVASGAHLLGNVSIGKLTIENINAKDLAYGLELFAGPNANNITINNVTATNGSAFGLIVHNGSVGNLTDVKINMSKEVGYHGVFKAEATNEKHQIKSVALLVDVGGVIKSDNVKYNLSGDIFADHYLYHHAELDQDEILENLPELPKGGQLSLKGDIQIFGDVYSVNNSEVDLSLVGDQSILVGQTDAWIELNDKQTLDHSVVLPVDHIKYALQDEVPIVADPLISGTINLSLTEGAIWQALGQSSLTLLDNQSTVDMTKSPGASVFTKRLKGNGTFNMTLDPSGKNSNMLYVANKLDDGAQNTINVQLTSAMRANASLDDLVGIRFATTGGSVDSYSGNEFKAQLLDQGFNNVTLTVAKEAYNKADKDTNEKFNGIGTGEGDYKPGNNYVDFVFGQEGQEGTNWYIGSQTVTPPVPDAPTPDKPNQDTQPELELSSVGHSVLATARSNYWTAVEMDRLNKRLGDARYANGNEGLWLRMRYESNGTSAGSGDFESDAVTYQAGFDHGFKRDNGHWIVGGAIDYKDAKVDYKSVTGEGGTDRLGLKVYGTWLGDNGSYVDLNGVWGALSNNFEIVNGLGEKVKADYNNHIMGGSLETGYRFNLPNNFFAEPQLQLQYLRVTDANYTTTQGTRMVHDEFDSVISRVGLRSGLTFGQAKQHIIYAKADWMHEWAGDQKIMAYDVTTSRSGFDASIDNNGSWFDFGFGTQAKFSDSSYGFVDMECRFGNSLENSWTVNAGVRYIF